jgi:hypothetical protein
LLATGKEERMAKSIEIKFTEALDALKKAGKTEVFTERSANCKGNVESKLIIAEAVLQENRIIKNNGDGGSSYISETDSKPFAAVDRIIMESLGFTDEQIRRANGEAPADVPADKVAEYEFLRSIRISESDAKKLLSQGYKF